jgi:GNAT superfamily N-acetyltransferase
MTYAIQELVIRDVAPVDTATIASVLAEAMCPTPVGKWLLPDEPLLRELAPGYFEIYAEHAIQHGEVYATADPDTGEVCAVALWFPLTAAIPPPVDYELRLKERTGPAFERACQLDATLEPEHPIEPHHYLAFLSVRPDRQNQGIGSALLNRHHARLDAAGIPAYLESNDPRNRDLYLRHGYTVQSEIRLPGGPPIWLMWREPMP